MENAERGIKQNLDFSKFVNLEDSDNAVAKTKTKYCNMTLLRMLEEGLYADVTIHANGGSVKAHKSVLVSVSPVFEAMFMHAMQEQLTSTVNIPDISIQGLELFLVLVYVLNDDIEAPWEFRKSILKHFDEIFKTCCKYQVSRLRPTLTETLWFHFTPENCWDYLDDKSPAWTHPECWNYIMENHQEVIDSERFISEMQTNPKTIKSFVIACLRDCNGW